VKSGGILHVGLVRVVNTPTSTFNHTLTGFWAGKGIESIFLPE